MMSNIEKLTTLVEIDEDLVVADYLAGRLSKEQQAQFEAQLKNSPDLQKRLSEEKNLAALLREAGPTVAISDDAFTQFNKKLDEDRSGGWWKARRPAYAVAGFLTLLCSTALLYQVNTNSLTGNDGEFETLSNGQQQVLNQSTIRYYSVVFEPGLTSGEQSALIESLNLAMISGPGQGNAYLVEAAAPLKSKQLQDIKANAKIVFFEPAVLREVK